MSSYIDHRNEGRTITHSWDDYTHQRLAWLYGPERALEILAKRDERTNADLARWSALGRRAAA